MSPIMDGQERTAPSAHEIEDLARAALARIPAPFADHLGDVVLLVEEWADDETLDALGIEDAYELTGLYHGRPVGEKSAFDGVTLPDRIHLYRRAILDEWVARGNVALGDLVRNVVVHELAHHFGWSDDDIARIDRWWE